MHTSEQQQISDDAPPFLRSWRNIYAAVLAYLLALILLLYLATRYFIAGN